MTDNRVCDMSKPNAGPVSVQVALSSWVAAGPRDPAFADLLEQIGKLDSLPVLDTVDRGTVEGDDHHENG
jgi:hypothetical protein